MKKDYLECVEINPAGAVGAVVIWLHGLGADGHDFAGIVPQLKLPRDLQVRFVFPHAPMQPVTLNAGYKMRAWFDIYALHENAPLDENGIIAMQQQIDALIDREIERGINSKHIVVAGFSQGGAMALHCGLRYAKPLAGIMGLSTFLLMPEKLNRERNVANNHTEIFLAHGIYDRIVPLQFGEISKDALIQLGYPVEWHTYPMEHQVCIEEIEDISRWLEKRLM